MEPYELSLAAAARAIRKGELKAADLARALIRRCQALDPRLHVMAHSDFERLVERAEDVDRRIAQLDGAGALAGAPLGVKDVFDCAGMPSGYGIRGSSAQSPQRTATSLERLLAAGALVFGKTATTERAFLDPAPTRNPWNPEHTPGGSSSGSAAGVAARIFPAALGTQTAGSVIRPAAYCGVIGMTLTRGAVPMDGILPLAPRFDTIGFFVREVEDAELLFAALTGGSGCGPAIADRSLAPLQRPVFLGFARRGFLDSIDDEAAHNTLQLAKHLLQKDIIVHVLKMPESFDEFWSHHRRILAKEVSWIHGGEFRGHPECFAPRIGAIVEEGLRVKDSDYHHSLEFLDRFRDEMLARISEVDAIILPSATGPAPRGLDSTGNPLCNAPWTAIGFPVISLPSGLSSSGLPLGLQVVGKPTGEHFLLRMARLLVRSIGFGCPTPAI
jgi:Asp-tRNA(Asn)/Glu-tRNA(Gln) amidotransferase A subunit family amidase